MFRLIGYNTKYGSIGNYLETIKTKPAEHQAFRAGRAELNTLIIKDPTLAASIGDLSKALNVHKKPLQETVKKTLLSVASAGFEDRAIAHPVFVEADHWDEVRDGERPTFTYDRVNGEQRYGAWTVTKRRCWPARKKILQ